MKTLSTFIALAIVLTLNAAASSPLDAVAVESGRLIGSTTRDGAVHAFKGVPYAAPPVGALRWRPPQALLAWNGNRTATEFPPSCPQNLARRRGPWTEEFMVQGDAGEDCLYLNLWTPSISAAARRPVYVWLHGGGFNEGSASIAVYDGEQMARRGIVVVGLNYRLGALGFLAHPDLTAESTNHSSGNYGLLDIIAGLKWIQKNVGAFGGDPTRVTLGGQSAGAMAVHALVASPHARGLFQRAIAESGPITATTFPALTEGEAVGRTLATAKGAKSAADLRMTSPDSLRAPVENAPFQPRPLVDGWILPVDPLTAFGNGRQNDVPTLTGLNADEGSASPTYQTSNKEAARNRGLAALEAWAAARAKTAKTNAYTYFFTQVIPWPQHPEYGAFHTSEVPYVFANLSKLDRPWTSIDRRVSDTMLDYWVNFIRSGNPNGRGLPDWPVFKAERHETMEIGERVGPRRVADEN
jgi:para-nitrobenzyl esterase